VLSFRAEVDPWALGFAARSAAVTIAGGESAGRARLRQWVSSYLAKYESIHDDLGADQISRLSPARTASSTRPCRASGSTPAGDYVRRYVPELAGLPAGVIHEPDAAARTAPGYPAPLVDHRAAMAEYRQRTRR
jgi:deoxyribodipyrimidine photolyase